MDGYVNHLFGWLLSGFCFNIIFRKTLRIVDMHDQLVALSVTHARQILQKQLKILLSQLKMLFAGELVHDNSRDPNFGFTALHFGWYNKYSEEVSQLLLLLLSINTYVY